MPQNLDVHLLPALTTPEQLAGKSVVVIDVLRATTTIIHALAAGAQQVLPCLEIEDARRLARQAADPQQVVLGGERGGLPIDGFHLGNSPLQYTPQTVGGKIVAFTTTNGTRALLQCRQARRVLVGAFVNYSALCRQLADQPQVALLCAGTDGQVTREDVLLAGALVSKLAPPGQTPEFVLNDSAVLAADAWRAVASDFAWRETLVQALASSRGGQNLLAIGHAEDIQIASQMDRFAIVPELDRDAWSVRLP